jgi:hypothetical protein
MTIYLIRKSAGLLLNLFVYILSLRIYEIFSNGKIFLLSAECGNLNPFKIRIIDFKAVCFLVNGKLPVLSLRGLKTQIRAVVFNIKVIHSRFLASHR